MLARITVETMRIRVSAGLVERLIKQKEKQRALLESRLDERELRQALEDHHARREPIPCGMTIHTGIGCNYGCLYCYVPDMGFPLKPRPYPLNGLQLAYSLLSNPYIVPSVMGTMLAFGSVTEPFLPETVEKTLEYLEAVKSWLGSPTQLSTKAYIDKELAKSIKTKAENRLSVLVTIITIRHARILEPGAPEPSKRFESIENLSFYGIHTTLFLRPIIPGITEKNLDIILEKAKASGAQGVVTGSLRITIGILRRLKAAGIDVAELLLRAPRHPRGRDQVPIRTDDIKKIVWVKAREYGLKVYPSACSANMDSHGLSCWACKWGPCGDRRGLPEVEPRDLVEAAELLTGIRPLFANIEHNTIMLGYPKGRLTERSKKIILHWLSALTKRSIRIKYA